MSELKAIMAYNTWTGDEPKEDMIINEVYLKSEADRYIAHQKMKRCLAMARACMEMQCETEQQADFAVRWEHRWLTLATYYKEMAK